MHRYVVLSTFSKPSQSEVVRFNSSACSSIAETLRLFLSLLLETTFELSGVTLCAEVPAFDGPGKLLSVARFKSFDSSLSFEIPALFDGCEDLYRMNVSDRLVVTCVSFTTGNAGILLEVWIARGLSVASFLDLNRVSD